MARAPSANRDRKDLRRARPIGAAAASSPNGRSRRKKAPTGHRGFSISLERFPSNAPLESGEKLLPRCCNQRLCGCMPIGANEHRCLLHLLRVGRFDDVYHIKATQCGETLFPGNTRTLPLDLLRHDLSQVLEVLRIVERLRGNATEDHECTHTAPPTKSSVHPRKYAAEPPVGTGLKPCS